MHSEGEREVRLGGALFAAGMLSLVVIVPLYLVVFGVPEGTGGNGTITARDYAMHLLEKWDFASRKWQVELCAVALIAISGFQLSHRNAASGRWISSRLTWVCVGVGALCTIPMYLVMLGGYFPAANGFQTDPTVYPALRGIATVTFGFGFSVVHLGLAGSFLIEHEGKVIPSWVALLGLLFNLTASALLFLVFVGVGSVQVAGPFGLVGYLFGLLLGLAIWRKG